jgi:uncharacterized membrane protein YecN with MAPEG domain
VIRPRTALLALAPLLLHALAREADRGLGLVLRSGLAPDGVVVEAARAAAAGGTGAAARVGLWLLAGTLAWLALGAWRRRAEGIAWAEALDRESQTLAPLYLRPALTVLALAAFALRSSYPYAFTLPVALTQDWSSAQDLAALAAVLALRLPAPRFKAPRAGEVTLLAFLLYALLVPDWAWRWEGHPGNEPKYLRQAVALGHDLTFDAAGVSAAMEELPTRPLGTSIRAALARLGSESRRMAVALAHGAAGKEAISATRITRQTVRGKDGGVYYVLAPGPSLLLAPVLRLDQAINRARGEEGRVAVSVLTWCALAALLVAALFSLVRDATGRDGLAAALALGFALLPPFLFYAFQFYPEMPGALVLAVAFRALALRPEGAARRPWLFGAMLATLPWLHQKFLPVWLVLVVTAIVVLWRVPAGAPVGTSRRWRMLGLVVPTLVSLYLTALYNFAIAGSVRPDALFLAWGPGGVTSARMGQGLLGLLLDARYGILPYVPVLTLAAAGLAVGGARRFAVVLPAAATYYLTVASADNWAGAVCNLGRYFMPVAPLAVAWVALAVHETTRPSTGGTPGSLPTVEPRPRRGAVALVLVLAAWSGLLAAELWRDPHAASDSALLLARSVYADGNQYIPNLFIRRWADGAPGLAWRVVAWLAGLVALAVWTRRVVRARQGRAGRPGRSPLAALFGLSGALLVAGLLLEHVAPPTRTQPRWGDTLPAAGGDLAFLGGASEVIPGGAVIGPGRVEILVRSAAPRERLRATVGGQAAVLRVPGQAPVVLRPTGALVDLPLDEYHVVRGRDGGRAVFSRVLVDVDGQAVLRLEDEREMEPTAGVAR